MAFVTVDDGDDDDDDTFLRPSMEGLIKHVVDWRLFALAWMVSLVPTRNDAFRDSLSAMIFSPICADDALLGFPRGVSENDDTLVRTDEEDEEDRREEESFVVNVPELLSPDNLDIRCWIPLTLDAVGPFVKSATTPVGKAGNFFSCPWPTLSGGLVSNTSSFLAISRSCTVSYR